MQEDKVDIIIFGASGFTGQYVVAEVLRDPSCTVALAGRNESLIRKKNSNQENLSRCKFIEADAKDDASLENMCSQGRVLINCVGPFRFYGESVVRACIKTGCDYVDICGEPEFLESIYVKYHEEAASRGVYIVGSCGFDSIPADIGLKFTRDAFDGKLTSCECFIKVDTGSEGYKINYATYQSAIWGFANSHRLARLRKGVQSIIYFGPRCPSRGKYFVNSSDDSYYIPFLGADRSVVQRTQRWVQKNTKRLPVRFSPYMYIGSFTNLVIFLTFSMMFGLLSKFSVGRFLLETFPRFFTFGYVSTKGPSKSQINSTSAILTFSGVGYKESSVQVPKPDYKIITRLSMPDPGYLGTSILVVEAALTLTRCRKSFRERGGVFTPGSIFDDTDIIDRLSDKGIHFEVLSTGPISSSQKI